MEITDIENQKKEEDFYGEDFEQYLKKEDKINSGTLKNDGQNKNKNYFEDLDEVDLRSRSELNQEGLKKNIIKNENENKSPIIFIKKKTIRKDDDEKKIKKKKQDLANPKTKTELNYQIIKNKNKQHFEDIYDYYNNDNNYLNIYDEPNHSEDFLDIYDDFDNVNSNKRKHGYITQLNTDRPENLDMLISNEFDK